VKKKIVVKKKKNPAKKKLVVKKFSKSDLKEFKKIVLKKKEELSGDLQHISDDTLRKSQKEASGDISGYTYHMADVATDNYDREFSLGLASGERKSLYELDDALKRIEDGSFGVCDDCKGPITKIRLKAVPSARLCIKCQQKREKK
jgi:DnaK suppressor protein